MLPWGLLLPALAFAAPGDLDTSFNQTGKYATTFNEPVSALAVGAAVQTDNKIVVAMHRFAGSALTFAVMRLNPDGTLDNTFSVGIVVIDLGVQVASANAVAVQTDGKIVVAGLAYFGNQADMVAARLNSNGTLDTSFNGSGKVILDFGVSATASALAIQSDGKIVLAGNAGNYPTSDFALARLEPDGGLDTSFNGNGKIIQDFGGPAGASGVAIQKDGKIVAAGTRAESADIGANTEFAVARYNRYGIPDLPFGSHGKAVTKFNMGLVGTAVGIQKGGRIIVAGYTNGTNVRSAVLAGFRKNGQLDASFGKHGKVVSDPTQASDAWAMAIQKDDRIVVGGSVPASGEFDLAVTRYQKQGKADKSFGDHGTVATDFGGFDVAFAIALQQDGRIVAAGSVDINSHPQVAVARYLGK
jgi:uncharacterized delta-60 repeat protein